jgi:hypothetical protein
MSTTMDQISLDTLYLRAKTAFNECLSSDRNAFLNQELNIPSNKIVTKNEWIRIQFSGNNEANYIIEVRLTLFSHQDKKIGYYCYHENHEGEVIDDYLVFE